MEKRLISLLAALALLVTVMPIPGLALESSEPAPATTVLPAADAASAEASDTPAEEPGTDLAGDSGTQVTPDTASSGISGGQEAADGEPAENSDVTEDPGTGAAGDSGAQGAARNVLAAPAKRGNTLTDAPVTTADELTTALEIAAANQATTIQLGADIMLDTPLTIAADKNIVLDLNGYTLSASKNKQNVIENNGTLTVKNGTVATVDAQSASEGFAVNNLAGATLTVAQDSGFTTKLIGRSGVNNYATVTVLNGTVESYNRNAYWGDAASSLLVEDGCFTSPNGSSGMGRAISTEGDVTIHGGTFYSGGSSGAGDNYMNAIGMFNGRTLIIEPAADRTVTVTSETDYAVSTMGNSKVEIKGGTFACNGVRADIKDFSSGNVTISGGTFMHEPIAAYLANGFVVVPAENGFAVKKAEASTNITVNSYAELAAALNDDMTRPKNITLGADVQIPADAVLTLKKGYTFDVPAGRTLTLDGILTLDGTMTNAGILSVGNNGFLAHPLQLTNNGTILDFPTVEDGVCRVSTPMQLQWLTVLTDADAVPARIELTQDIAMPAADFTPIGSSENAYYYNSTFDGCGHTVSGLQIDVTSAYRGGMFGFVGDATVQNLTIDKARVSSTSSYIGAVAGLVQGDSTFRNVHVTNSTVSSPISYGVGGFAGQIDGERNNRVEFIHCSLAGTSVTGYANVGAFWGTSTGSQGTIGIYNCTLDGSVEALNVNGAICGGYASSAKVQIIGLDHEAMTLTVNGGASSLLISADSSGANDLTNADASNIAIKNEKGE